MKTRKYNEKIISIEHIERLSIDIKSKNKKIITTNGCFDIIHPGHIDYLQRASEFGDIFIVGINSDASTSRLKGANRPINNEQFRSSIIAALGFVDYCVIFPHDTPVELLKMIRPHVHVKGGDYKAGDLPEKAVVEEQGGRIEIIPFLEGFSTTSIIEKIKKSG